VEQFALVETVRGGRAIGITRVAWLGDAETWWAAGASAEHFSQHAQALAQALATRQEWLNFLLLVSSGMLKVAVALATTPFSPLTIWTTWNYLRQVVQEYQQIRLSSIPIPA
jgi:hypothetical protein